jgi:hypothetical protein
LTRDKGPGVPEALPRTLRLIQEELGADTVDRVWIFPPLIRGRKEWGLIAVSRVDPVSQEEHGPDSGNGTADGRRRRTVYTAVYSAERTGMGLTVEPALIEEGAAPEDRLPRVMDGVVRRSGGELGDPREVALSGDAQRFAELIAEFEPADGPAEGGYAS